MAIVSRPAAYVVALACGLTLAVVHGADHALSHPAQSQSTQTQEPQRPVFRTGVNVVRVDVYPRRRNRIVEGLTKEDFRLTEDGVPQAIETFEYIPIEMDRAGEPLDPRTPSEARRMAADPRNRVFIFYLDVYQINFEGAARSREPLLEFLQRSMGPRDLYAWMTPKHSPEFLEFTRMSQGLASLLTVAKPWGKMDTPVDDPEEMKLQACAPGPDKNPFAPNGLVVKMRELEVLTDLRELIIRLGALREERKNLVILGERWHNITSILPEALPAAPPVRVTPRAHADQRGRGSFEPPSSPTLDAWRFCADVASYLRRQDFRSMTLGLPELARRHNVALYFVSLAPKTLSNFSLAGSFADETDGRAIVSNDVSLNLSQVLEHQTGFYMLGYRSTAGEAGAKPRTVRVRTTRDGVDLDVRRIYEPPPPEFLASRDSPAPPVERTVVQQAIDALPPVRDDRELTIRAVPRASTVDVTVELDGRLAATVPWKTGGHVTIAVNDAARNVLQSGEASFSAGERSVRVLVALPADQAADRVFVKVSSAGDGALSDSVPVGTAVESPLGPPILSRAGSLPRLPYLPTAQPTFGRTERLRIEWPVTGRLEGATVRLLNAAGEALTADIAAGIISAPDQLLRADVRLLSLAPGEYVVEAAGTMDGTAVRQLTGIRVTR